jgi:rubrerythrin
MGILNREVAVDELEELWDTAIYKEIAAQSLYLEAQKETDEPAARLMLAELAAEELKHAETLKKMKEAGWQAGDCNLASAGDLKLSDYMQGPDTLEGAGLQEVLIFAMKRELESVHYYTQMMGMLRQESAKMLCMCLAQEEVRHKMKLEMEYQRLFPEKEY